MGGDRATTWCMLGLISSIVYSSGFHILGRMWKHWGRLRGRQLSCKRLDGNLNEERLRELDGRTRTS